MPIAARKGEHSFIQKRSVGRIFQTVRLQGQIRITPFSSCETSIFAAAKVPILKTHPCRSDNDSKGRTHFSSSNLLKPTLYLFTGLPEEERPTESPRTVPHTRLRSDGSYRQSSNLEA